LFIVTGILVWWEHSWSTLLSNSKSWLLGRL
jgi:hypothetical protein